MDQILVFHSEESKTNRYLQEILQTQSKSNEKGKTIFLGKSSMVNSRSKLIILMSNSGSVGTLRCYQQREKLVSGEQ